ncbi:aminoglycoside phosphotransferase family protein [Microbacterium sp. Mu-80]|uniref:Aminoglycoside phosphotransferase family protein n=1 Tax=Microbacterium bandirmense TaxID=3122050 RepID=A0ABU8LBV8_9MICO
MTDWHGGRLSAAQSAWVGERMPDAVLVRDMSWHLVASTVLHVRGSLGGEEVDAVVKAGDATNHHIDREIAAHAGWTDELVSTRHAARLLDAHDGERVMLLDYLPGALVEGTDAEAHIGTYAQAGALLRRLHDQERRVDAEYEARVNARALRWLDGEHRVDAVVAARARSILSRDPAPPVEVVPTHGDWQPRNWLADGDVVRVIDFGRFAFRPAATDLVRLAAQQWRGRPDLEAAFLASYGDDPRDADRSRMNALREAIGTACWAFQVGDAPFEAQGHRMLDAALRAF